MKKKVLVVGAGRRAHCVVFPALRCLSGMLDVVAIHTRTRRRIQLFQGVWDYETIQDLSKIDFSAIDIIVVVVPPEQVSLVIVSLGKHTSTNSVLIIDTPVLPLTKLGTLRTLFRFKKVLVAEDLLAFPPFVLAKKMINDGVIGSVQHIHLFHSGFKYHALASLKWLTGTNSISWIRSRAFFGEIRLKTMRFPGGVHATMLEPRDYKIGKWFIAGTKGSISDYSIQYKHSHAVGYQLNSGRYEGMTLDGVPVPPNELDTQYRLHIQDNTFENSLMNDLKIRGYMDIIVSTEQVSSVFHYRPLDGIYDAFVMKVVDKFGFFFDVKIGKFSALQFLLRIVSKITPR